MSPNKTSKKSQPSRVIALMNSSATNAGRAENLLSDIKKLFPKIELKTVDITGYNREKIQDVIEQSCRKADENTLICIGGGDGTASSVVSAFTLSNKLSAKSKKAIILPLWGGNANDLATMLNGATHSDAVKKLFDEGSIVKIYPLSIKITPPGQLLLRRVAACYASFGASAQASKVMEQFAHIRGKDGPKNIVHRVFHEIKDSLLTFVRISSFGVRGEKGKIEHMYERVFVNGSRFARLPNTAVKLTDRKYLEASAKKKHIYIVLYAFNAFIRKNHGEITDKTKKFVIKDATMAQIDGEIIGLEAETNIEISIHDTPFYALSRKLS